MNRRPSGPIELGIAGISDAREIGAGGFGVVYRAVEEDLGRTVAVKVLSGNLDESAQYRFERERRAMGRLSGHPNIVTIYRGGYTPEGNAYLVMEYLDRGSLADRLAKAGPLGWEEATMFGVQLSGALETSHRAGVLHRDIKPANILLSALGNAKLCDFGIARLQGAPETRSSVVTASLSHAPPDIVNGARPDARSDVYSLASTLFELVAGTPPFIRPEDESMVPILARIARDPVPRLPETQLPGPLYDVIERAMSKEPDERPATAVELGTLLASTQQQLGIAPTTIPIEASGPGGGSGRSGYIPFPDSSADPLPAPTGRSPHDATPGETRPPVTSEQALPGQTAPPTVVTSPTPGAASISQETVVSGQHDPATWAPPSVSGEVQSDADARPTDAAASAAAPSDVADRRGVGSSSTPPDSPDRVRPEAAQTGSPPWLIPVVVAVVVLAAIGGGFLLFSGDDDATATEGADEVAATETSVADEADAGGSLDDEATEPADETESTIAGRTPDDYPFYETITDDTGSITIAVPTEWTDRRTNIGTDGLPQITAAPLINDGFVGTSDVAGVQVTVAKVPDDFDAAIDLVLDVVLDGYGEDQCTSAGRMDISFPLPGRVERFQDCDGGETRIVHFAYFDEAEELTAVMRIQIVSDRDDAAVETIRSSLVLEDNVPE